MPRSRAWPAWTAGVVLVLSACKSFRCDVKTPDPRPIQSMFLLVAKRDALRHGSPQEIMEIVRPEKYGDYPFFVQLQPDSEAEWEVVQAHGPVEPKVGKDRVSVKFPRSFIEGNPDSSVALVVWYGGRDFQCKTEALVLKGSCEFVAGSSDLVATR